VLVLEKSTLARQSGAIFWIFVGMTSASRLFLEAFRGDSTLILGGFRQDQLLAWIVLVFSLFGLYKRVDFSPRQEESD